MKVTFAIILLFICSGCMIKYVPPSEGPTASINFKNDSRGKILISFYEKSSQCERKRYTPLMKRNSNASHITYADKELTFEYIMLADGMYCKENLRFYPEKDHKYLFRTTYGANKCLWIMEDITQEKNPKQVKLSQISWKQGWHEDGSFCRENSQ